MVSARSWCFTLNNYTPEDEAEVATWEGVRYCVFGREVAPTTGTPHLQGFVVFNNARAFNAVRTRLRGRGHWTITRGSPTQASEYCKKDGDFVERGVLPAGQGFRSDLRQLQEWVDEFIVNNRRAPTDAEWARHQFAAFVRYPRIVEASRLRAAVEVPPVLRQGEPRAWQLHLANELSMEADDRTIIFYVDEDGNTGKTWFAQWLFTQRNDDVQLLGVGKRDDMAYMVDETKCIFLIDVKRGGMEFLQYSILEQLKDRCVISPKYQSRAKILMKVPHVVVFCNERPDATKLSADRVHIVEDFNL